MRVPENWPDAPTQERRKEIPKLASRAEESSKRSVGNVLPPFSSLFSIEQRMIMGRMHSRQTTRSANTERFVRLTVPYIRSHEERRKNPTKYIQTNRPTMNDLNGSLGGMS